MQLGFQSVEELLDTLSYPELKDWEIYYEDHLFTDDANNLLNAFNIYYTVLGYVDPKKAKDIKVEDFLINQPKKQQQTSEEQFEMINKVISEFNNRRERS